MTKIIAFGNPLLDTTVYIDETSLLKKYNLLEDGQKEIRWNEMESLSSDILKYQKFYSAGGCAQNSLRVLQWLLEKQCKATIFGSAGDDKEAKILKKLINDDGVSTKYLVQNKPTGRTVALVNGPYRTLVAYIGAAEILPLSDLSAEKDFKPLILESDYVYIEGFFLTNREETATFIIDFCNSHNKVVIFNISGEYVCDLVPKTVEHFVRNSDIIFGNKREFEAVRKIMKLENIDALNAQIFKHNTNKLETGKLIVITDGPNPGVCLSGNRATVNFSPLDIEKQELKDSTGAGDAFVGGFIAGLCLNRNLEQCVQIACYASKEIIKQTGVTLPNYKPQIMALTF